MGNNGECILMFSTHACIPSRVCKIDGENGTISGAHSSKRIALAFFPAVFHENVFIFRQFVLSCCYFIYSWGYERMKTNFPDFHPRSCIFCAFLIQFYFTLSHLISFYV